MAKFTLKGSTIKIGAAAGAPATVIGQVVSGTCTYGARNMVDMTTVEEDTETNAAGNKAPLNFSVTVALDPGGVAAHDTVIDAWAAGTLVSAGAFFRDGAASGTKPSIYSDGTWTNVTAPISVNGRMEATFEFMGTGAPTVA
jgi:hypothetical protein